MHRQPLGHGGKPDREVVMHVVGIVDHGQAVVPRLVLNANGRLIQPRALHRKELVDDGPIGIKDDLERVRTTA